MRLPETAVLVAALLIGCASSSQTPVASTRAAVERLVAESGGEAAVVFRPLDGAPDPAREIHLQGTARFHAASMMKVPVMIELFRRAETGELRLDDTVPVTNRFRSIVDGSPYELSTSDDSDGEVYKAIGHPMSYRALNEAMITVSSNLAANILIDRLDAGQIRKTTAALGASGIEVLRGVEDQKAFDRGLNNSTDAEALATLFWKLGRGDVVSPAASAAMIEVLKRQAFHTGIPAGVPAGTAVAHKTGSITLVRHDGGIVFAPRPYVLVVLTRGLEAGKADALIAAISRTVFPLGR